VGGRRRRGFTVAELMTVLVVLGLVMTTVAFAVPLMLKAPIEAQSQVDDVQSAALALYKMQHDARPSTIKGMFSCTIAPMITCSDPTPPPAPQPLPQTQAIVLVTANGTGQFSDLKGNPNWQGYVAYWLTPNADGSSNELRRAYFPTSVDPTQFLTQAVNALTSVLLAPGYTTVAQDVRSMSAAYDRASSIVELQLDGGDTKGNQTSLQLSGNSYVRN
jgi:prepilin-type N-terminal cleavage/methylation domain-containing protein